MDSGPFQPTADIWSSLDLDVPCVTNSYPLGGVVERAACVGVVCVSDTVKNMAVGLQTCATQHIVR